MPKVLRHIVAFLLIPCLMADSVHSSVAFISSSSVVIGGGSITENFTSQALALSAESSWQNKFPRAWVARLGDNLIARPSGRLTNLHAWLVRRALRIDDSGEFLHLPDEVFMNDVFSLLVEDNSEILSQALTQGPTRPRRLLYSRVVRSEDVPQDVLELGKDKRIEFIQEHIIRPLTQEMESQHALSFEASARQMVLFQAENWLQHAVAPRGDLLLIIAGQEESSGRYSSLWMYIANNGSPMPVQQVLEGRFRKKELGRALWLMVHHGTDTVHRRSLKVLPWILFASAIGLFAIAFRLPASVARLPAWTFRWPALLFGLFALVRGLAAFILNRSERKGHVKKYTYYAPLDNEDDVSEDEADQGVTPEQKLRTPPPSAPDPNKIVPMPPHWVLRSGGAQYVNDERLLQRCPTPEKGVLFAVRLDQEAYTESTLPPAGSPAVSADSRLSPHRIPIKALMQITKGSPEEIQKGEEYSLLQFGKRPVVKKYGMELAAFILREFREGLHPKQHVLASVSTALPRAGAALAAVAAKPLGSLDVIILKRPPSLAHTHYSPSPSSKTRMQRSHALIPQISEADALRLQGKHAILIDAGAASGKLIGLARDVLIAAGALDVSPFVVARIKNKGDPNYEEFLTNLALNYMEPDVLTEILRHDMSICTGRLVHYAFDLEADIFSLWVNTLTLGACLKLYLSAAAYFGSEIPPMVDHLAHRLQQELQIKNIPDYSRLSAIREDHHFRDAVSRLLESYGYRPSLHKAREVIAVLSVLERETKRAA